MQPHAQTGSSSAPLEELLERYLEAGDEAAMEELVARTRPRLLVAARRIAGPAEAEDAVQAAFYSLLRRRGQPPLDSVEAWLVTVVVRTAYRRRAQQARAHDLAEKLASEPRDGGGATADPAAVAEDAEISADLWTAVHHLPARYRDTLVLFYLQGLGTEEVARLLDVPIGTVCSRLGRGRSLLRSRLGPRLAHLLAFPLWLFADLAHAAPAAAFPVVVGVFMKVKVIAVTVIALLAVGLAVHLGQRPVAAPPPAPVARAEAPAAKPPARRAAPEVAAEETPAPVAEPEAAEPPAPAADPGTTVSGRVVDESGAAKPGAEVTGIDDRGHRFGATVTDERGQFVSTGLPAGQLLCFDVTLAGFALSDSDAAARAFMPGARDAVLVVTREVRIRGTVRDPEGQPLSGSYVYGAPPARTHGMGRNTKTAADGTYELVGLTAGLIDVGAHAPEGQPAALAVRQVTAMAGQVLADIDLVLGPAGTIAGRIITRQGDPVPGVTVHAWEGMHHREATSDEHGEWSLLAISTSPHRLGVTAAGFDTDRWNMEAQRSLALPGSYNIIELDRGTLLRGRVIDEKGAPIPSFTLELVEWSRFGKPMPLRGKGGERQADDGRFSLAGLPESLLDVEVTAEGRAGIKVDLRGRASGGVIDLGDLVLRSGATLVGRVLAPDGTPAAGAAVRCVLAGALDAASVFKPLPAAQPTAAGDFRIEHAPAGTVVLLAEDPQLGPGRTQLEVPEAGEVTGIVIQLAAAAVLWGQITGAGGTPTPGCEIDAWQEAADAAVPGKRWSAKSDAAGRYEIPGLGAGVYTVNMTLPHMRVSRGGMGLGEQFPREVEVTAGARTECSFDFRTGCKLHGKVSGIVHQTLQPSEDSGGMSMNGASGHAYAQVGADGSYAFTPLPPGEYSFRVWWGSSMTGSGTHVMSSVVLPEASEHRMDIELPSGTISGRVLDARGAGFPGARVHGQVASESQRSMYESSIMTLSAEDGSFTLHYLQPGTYVVSAHAGEQGQARLAGLELGDGDFLTGLELELAVPDTGSVRIRTEDESGAPLPVTRVGVVDAMGKFPGSTESLAPADWRLTGLAPGTYRALAGSPAAGTMFADQVVVQADQETEVILRRSGPLGRISGTVTLDGRPAHGARVTILDAGGHPLPDMSGGWGLEILCKATGKFTTGLLPSGRCRLRVVLGDAEVTVDATIPESEVPAEVQVSLD